MSRKSLNPKFPIILITGTPGTGKSTVANYLAKKLTFHSINLTELVKRKHLASSYDKKRQCYVVDTERLNSALKSEISRLQRLKNPPKGLILDSHLSHFFPAKEASLCIICRCSLPVLRKRLEARKYPPEKVRENIDSEIFEVCLQEAIELGHTTLQVDTSKKNCLGSVLRRVKNFLK